jgi:hypothetical protein
MISLVGYDVGVLGKYMIYPEFLQLQTIFRYPMKLVVKERSEAYVH